MSRQQQTPSCQTATGSDAVCCSSGLGRTNHQWEGADASQPTLFSSTVTFEQIRQLQAQFVKARDWAQFHTPRNVLLALVGEVGELSEVFQWKASCVFDLRSQLLTLLRAKFKEVVLASLLENEHILEKKWQTFVFILYD